MDDGEIAELSPKGIALWDKSGSSLQKKTFFVDWDVSMAEKGGYPHFMLKEIHEQGGVCRSTLKDRLIDGSVDLSAEISLDEKVASRFEGIHLVACGTSYYAALVAERVFERWTDLDLKVDIASEYRYRQGKIGPDTLVVFVSQSGETADTIAAERKAREMGAYCLAVTNVRARLGPRLRSTSFSSRLVRRWRRCDEDVYGANHSLISVGYLHRATEGNSLCRTGEGTDR